MGLPLTRLGGAKNGCEKGVWHCKKDGDFSITFLGGGGGGGGGGHLWSPVCSLFPFSTHQIAMNIVKVAIRI